MSLNFPESFDPQPTLTDDLLELRPLTLDDRDALSDRCLSALLRFLA